MTSFWDAEVAECDPGSIAPSFDGGSNVATPEIVRAHRHTSRQRDEVLASEQCGCFYCCAVFPPSEVTDWTDEWEGVARRCCYSFDYRLDSIVKSVEKGLAPGAGDW